MALAMATQQQIDSIQEMVDQGMRPAEIGGYLERVADLDITGVNIARGIAAKLIHGVPVAPDHIDLTDFIKN